MQNRIKDLVDALYAHEEEGLPGFGCAEYVPEPEDAPRDESSKLEHSDADRE